jgi:hypothetical protein
MVLFACQKQIDYQPQINILNSNISALQKSRDSLAAALAQSNNNLNTTNINVAALSKSLDSIKVQLTSIGAQIATLNSQMTTANANIATLTSQIAALNLQYIDLLAKYNAIILQLTPSSLNSGLIAYYPFNGNANDSSVNGYNGTVTGASLTTDRFGSVNKAYNFNGIKGYPNDPEIVQEIVINNKFINLSNDYTITIWMNSTNISKVNQAIFNSIGHTGFVVELNNNNVPNKLMYGVGNSITFWDLIYASGTSTSFQNNVWRHIVFIKSGTSYELYLDGKLERTSIVSKSSSYSERVGLRIGSIGGGNEVFKGALDDVRVYNRVLTSKEIAYLNLN